MKQRESPTDLIGSGAPRPTPVSSTREPNTRDETDIRLGSCRHVNRGEASNTYKALKKGIINLNVCLMEGYTDLGPLILN